MFNLVLRELFFFFCEEGLSVLNLLSLVVLYIHSILQTKGFKVRLSETNSVVWDFEDTLLTSTSELHKRIIPQTKTGH